MGKLATSHERLAHEKKAVPGKRPENRIAMNDEESPSKIVKRRTKTGCLSMYSLSGSWRVWDPRVHGHMRLV